MEKLVRGLWFGVVLTTVYACANFDQKPLTWRREVQQRFEANNPNLHDGQLGADRSKANEITAYLCPNFSLTMVPDQIGPLSGGPSHSLHVVANAFEFQNTMEQQ
jgi:hypothetical protein